MGNKTHTKLDKLYDNKKARSFLNHLVKAYVPMDKVEAVWEKPTGKFKCALTNEPLITCDEIMELAMTHEYQQDFLEKLKTIFHEDTQENHPLKGSVDNKRMLGVIGENTDTYMSYPAFQDFYSWVLGKMLIGDKHINWLVGGINKENFIERAEKIADTPEAINSVERMKNMSMNRNVARFGDLPALQALKAKFDSEEN